MNEKRYESPKALLYDKAFDLAQRAVDRIAANATTPDEYSQLAPLIGRFFDRKRREQETAK